MKVNPTNGPTSSRGGFTLVELLTVIVIISILAGLATVAAQMGIRTAKRTTIGADISQLSMALQNYKDERGDYPPDFCGVNLAVAGNYPVRTAILRHLRRAFPKYRPGVSGAGGASDWDRFRNDVIAGCGVNVENMTPASALVFWLGGLPDASGSSKLNGFSANPANPFAQGGTRLPAYFDFDETRLVSDGNMYHYVPQHVKSPDGADGAENIAPYVYFQARSKNYLIPGLAADTIKFYQPASIPGVGTAWPYARENVTPIAPTFANVKWFEPDKFQIICSGLDGMYGPIRSATDIASVRYVAPDEYNLISEEDDNQTSFAQGILGDWSEGK